MDEDEGGGNDDDDDDDITLVILNHQTTDSVYLLFQHFCVTSHSSSNSRGNLVSQFPLNMQEN